MANRTTGEVGEGGGAAPHDRHGGAVDGLVRAFLESNLSIVLILLASVIGLVALLITPREEDPQIVVPMADLIVNYPGHSAAELEQLVATPLEKVLYEIDGVEYVYSTSSPDKAIITARFYVGQDRERSLVKLFKKIDENRDIVPTGATWVVKPVEIDDVPIVTLTLTSPTVSGHVLRRVGEEMVQRLASLDDLSRAYVVGGEPRVVRVQLDPARMEAHGLAPLEIGRAISAASTTLTAGEFTRQDRTFVVEAGGAFTNADDLGALVVGVSAGRPVRLRDTATVIDGPDEANSYVRHAWGAAHAYAHELGAAGTLLGGEPVGGRESGATVAVTVAVAKKKGANAVWVAESVLEEAEALRKEIVPSGVDVVITRNYGLSADHKVNELVEALAVAIVIVVGLLFLSLGWREAIIVAVAVPVVFGLTLAVNQLAGFSINRVTLFALILSLGLLVDDPIVDVENISRHFALRGRASRRIVLEAVSEIRPPLISATLAVILSFIPMLFITGMMGPYMRPLALNVPVAMLMSMLVAFTITPWLAFHVLKGRYQGGRAPDEHAHGEIEDIEEVRRSALWKLFYPLMAPLLRSRRRAWGFLLAMGALTLGAVALAGLRAVPLKMLPFDNKNELMLVLDFDEGTTLERTDAAVRDFERYIASVPEVADLTSYVGVASPMDFNGMVRHYYLRKGANVAEIRLNLIEKKRRRMQSHAIGLRMRADLQELATRHQASLKIVETPPGPPVIETIVAEVYGAPHHTYEEIGVAAKSLRARLEKEPGVVDVDDTLQAPQDKFVFVADKEKAALAGVTVDDVARTLQTSLTGSTVASLRVARERHPLDIRLQLPRRLRSSTSDLAAIRVQGTKGLVSLSELGRWEQAAVDQTVYHKNLKRVVYVLADTAGRAPAEAIVDFMADQTPDSTVAGEREEVLRPLKGRTYFRNGSGLPWTMPAGMRVALAGEGEWKITLDVFRDLGLAFLAALVAIYILLVWQCASFSVPIVVMMAIPLTAIGVLPGFFLLNLVSAGKVGAYDDPVFFTATAMIGMIALAGIVTRDSIILVDFIQLSLRRGRSLFDAIMESRVLRLRPILLTAGAALLSALPITIDPIFSGLAWSLIFGLVSSTVFTLFVIPVSYWLLHESKHPATQPEASDPVVPDPSSV